MSHYPSLQATVIFISSTSSCQKCSFVWFLSICFYAHIYIKIIWRGINIVDWQRATLSQFIFSFPYAVFSISSCEAGLRVLSQIADAFGPNLDDFHWWHCQVLRGLGVGYSKCCVGHDKRDPWPIEGEPEAESREPGSPWVNAVGRGQIWSIKNCRCGPHLDQIFLAIWVVFVQNSTNWCR